MIADNKAKQLAERIIAGDWVIAHPRTLEILAAESPDFYTHVPRDQIKENAYVPVGYVYTLKHELRPDPETVC